jgi:glycosyltransferase involved in cell wall biosynthesis
MLRVGYNARQLTEPAMRGWNRYAINLIESLARLDVHPVLYAHGAVHPMFLERLPEGGYSVVVSPPMNYARWLARWVPNRMRADRLDLFHTTFNFGLPPWGPCPRVLTLHDAVGQAAVGVPIPGVGPWAPGAAKSTLDHIVARASADAILTVSDSARRELVEVLRLPASKVTAIHEAADPLFSRPVTADDLSRMRSRHDLPDRYAFYIGGWDERKNLPFLLRAFALADAPGLHLVLAGGKGEEWAALEALARELNISERLHLLGWIEEEDLPALYASARAFAYPSRHEGFGLQLCEAMAVGCPCLAADATSLPEVLGDGGATFPLDDPATLAGLLRRVATDDAYHAELADRARRRGAAFSWEATAEATLRVYRALVEKARARP